MNAGKKIKEYWEERAFKHLQDPAATTNDIYLRELEIATIIDTLKDISKNTKKNAIDIGCGDGYSTIRIAKEIAHLSFIGIDYSQNMIKIARSRLQGQPDLITRLRFEVSNVINIQKLCKNKQFDIAITDRCLINLESKERQRIAIEQIGRILKPNGYYLAIENFVEGHNNMNNARKSIGLDEIPIRWHNLYFDEKVFLDMVAPFFDLINFNDFSSSYYFATRVIYSGLCKMRGEVPQYDHEIHQFAGKLPRIGQFSPIRMAILMKKSS